MPGTGTMDSSVYTKKVKVFAQVSAMMKSSGGAGRHTVGDADKAQVKSIFSSFYHGKQL
jgi:hypothetical protein